MTTRHCRLIAKFHYTDTDTDPTRTRPDQTKSAHVVGYELNSTTRARHGPDRTRTDFFCGETPLGPCGSGRALVVEFSYKDYKKQASPVIDARLLTHDKRVFARQDDCFSSRARISLLPGTVPN